MLNQIYTHIKLSPNDSLVLNTLLMQHVVNDLNLICNSNGITLQKCSDNVSRHLFFFLQVPFREESCLKSKSTWEPLEATSNTRIYVMHNTHNHTDNNSQIHIH